MRVVESNPYSSILRNAQPQQKTNAQELWQGFADRLQGAIDEVDGLQKHSQKMTQDVVLGRVENLHDVMIAAEKARTAMNLTLEVRAKALESYKEIMRMQF